jgi:hypothetical protein
LDLLQLLPTPSCTQGPGYRSVSTNTSTVTRVYRTAHADQFLILSNAMARGQEPIKLKALAFRVLLFLLSLPQGWRMDREQLDRAFLEGRDSITRAIKQLEEAHYLYRTRTRTQAGKWEWTWEVTDDPNNHPLNDRPLNFSARPDQGLGESAQVAPPTENPSPVNQSILEDGYKNTESKKTPLLVRHEGQGVEPLPSRVAVATTVSAPSDGAHQTPASMFEAHIARWRAAGVLCEGCSHRNGPHRVTGFCS